MNKIPSELSTYLSSIQKVEFNNSTIIFYTDEGVFLYLPVSCDKIIYSYLDEIDFNNYCELVRDGDGLSLFKVSSIKQANPIVLLTSLYNKSKNVKRFSFNQKYLILNRLKEENNYLMNYYHDMQDKIEEMFYPMNTFYQLLIHMSDIYRLLYIGNYFIDKWNEKSNDYFDEVLIIKNLDSSNFIDDGIVDFSVAKKDYYVFELTNYYQKYFLSKNIIKELNYFENNYSMSLNDKYLFYGLICNVWKINGEIIEEVYDLNQYVKTTLSYLSEKYEEDQKQEEEMLEE